MKGGKEWNGFYFSDSIKDFGYGPGFNYNLIVLKTPVKNQSADAIGITYKLVKSFLR